MTKRRRNAYFLAAALLVAAAFAVSVCVGKYPLSGRDIFTILSGGSISEMKRNVFFTLRVPRTMMALLAGAGLGMAGSVFQLIFKNPLASPDIIGVSSGANLGAAVAIVFLGHSTVMLASSAFLGGIAVMALVIVLVRMTGHGSTTTYILAGIIMKSVSEAFIMILKFYADPEKQLAAIEFWSMGSFGGITADKLKVIFPIFLVGFLGLVLMRRQISLLGLEEEESRMLGVRVKPVRVAVLSFATLMVASIICLTGLITFIGLIAPHIARLILKRISFAWCALSSLVGAFILLLSDCLARSIYSAEVPISILTTFIGVPCLIYFMRKRKAEAI